MRKLVVFLVVVVFALVAIDFVARALAERRIAQTMQAELDLSEDPSVGIDAFPFTLALLDGNFSEVTVTAEGVGGGDVELGRTRITFEDVEFSLGQLLSGERRSVRIASAEGQGSLSDNDVTAALQEAGAPATVRFQDGEVVVTSDEIEGEIRGELGIEDGTLVILPASASQIPELGLPEFTRGLTYEGVEIQGRRAVLTFTLDRTRFTF